MSTNSPSASQNWKSIWNKKDMPDVSILEGEDLWNSLIKADGFDGGTGEIKIDHWKDYMRFLKKNLDVTPSDSVFEVGCGAGAFLYFFFLEGSKVGGIDYSSTLIENAKRIMQPGRFEVCEAANLQVEFKYDFVVANSIFFYFPDLEYAEKVLERMLEKATNAIGIFDVPNAKLKKDCETERMAKIDNYKEKYKGLPHLYYDKSWFLKFAETNNCGIYLFDQNIKDYGNSRYRFNCILRKKVQ